MEKKKVIVVGGGIIGLATAYYLDLEGHNAVSYTHLRAHET